MTQQLEDQQQQQSNEQVMICLREILEVIIKLEALLKNEKKVKVFPKQVYIDYYNSSHFFAP
jgi:hypothetical protein